MRGVISYAPNVDSLVTLGVNAPIAWTILKLCCSGRGLESKTFTKFNSGLMLYNPNSPMILEPSIIVEGDGPHKSDMASFINHLIMQTQSILTPFSQILVPLVQLTHHMQQTQHPISNLLTAFLIPHLLTPLL